MVSHIAIDDDRRLEVLMRRLKICCKLRHDLNKTVFTRRLKTQIVLSRSNIFAIPPDSSNVARHFEFCSSAPQNSTEQGSHPPAE